MQIQTTTITTENQTVFDGTNFQIKTYEQTTTAFCDCCPNQSTGTKTELVRRGWEFWAGSEFCPMCN